MSAEEIAALAIATANVGEQSAARMVELDSMYWVYAEAVVTSLKEAGLMPEPRTDEYYGHMDSGFLLLTYDGTGKLHRRTVYKATPWQPVEDEDSDG